MVWDRIQYNTIEMNEEVEEAEGAERKKKSITQSGKTAVKTAVKTSVH